MKTADIERRFTDYSRVRSWNKLKFEKLSAVLGQMQTAGIDCILLKGADLIPRLYGVLGVRTLGDADLLVHESDLPAIDHLLTRSGYRPVIDGNPAYVDPDNILALDIITNVWYVDEPDVIWRRAVQRQLHGIPVKGLGSDDLLIYLTAYSVVHRGYLSAAFARDIRLLVEKERLDWAFIVDEASRRHVRTPLYHGLSYVSRHVGVPIPDHIRSQLAPSGTTEKLLYLLFQKLVTDKPIAELGHLLLFLTRPGVKKWRGLSDALFPSPAFLTYRYGDRWHAHPLATRLSRPFSLMSQALRLFVRVSGRLLKRPEGALARTPLR
jgi:putative nucleotidyltransferase-like protein